MGVRYGQNKGVEKKEGEWWKEGKVKCGRKGVPGFGREGMRSGRVDWRDVRE